MEAFTPDIKGIRTPETTNPRINMVKKLTRQKRGRRRAMRKVVRSSLPFEV